MIDVTEIARGIHRISLWEEEDLMKRGLMSHGFTINMFLIKARRPAIIETLLRNTFKRVRRCVEKIVDPAKLRYLVIPHHEGDSSGAINEWLRVAPRAVPLCSELCAVLSLRDFSNREPKVVSDGQVIDLGSHRLRFLVTPYVNQMDSLMVYEESTCTLFPNDLFCSMGTEIVTTEDHSEVALRNARELGYQADDRVNLNRALDKIAKLDVKVVATMHGPAVIGHVSNLIEAFRNNVISV